jgi:hypothetical protein
MYCLLDEHATPAARSAIWPATSWIIPIWSPRSRRLSLSRLEVACIPRVAATAHKRPLPCHLAETDEELVIRLGANTLNVVFAANPAAMHVWHTPF